MAAVKGVQVAGAVDLGALLDAGEGAVVTLVVGETQLAAHRAVLAARSPVFQAMFQHDTLEASSGRVSITDVGGEVMRQVLSYIYTLQTPQLSGTAQHLLAAADKYGLSALKDVCEQQVAAQLTTENAAAAAVLAVRHSCPKLTAAAIAFIKAHNFQVLATQGWADAMCSHPQELIEVSRLLADPPAEISTPATTEEGPATSAQTPATAAPVTSSQHTPPPDDAAVSRLRSLSSDEKGRRLIQAAHGGVMEELRALLAAGADVRAMDGDRSTALHWAAWEGHVEAVTCLLENGAEVNARNIRHNTPLHSPANDGLAAVVRLLLRSSADANARNAWGLTPLHCAAREGRLEVATELLEFGANKEARDDEGNTPRQLARKNNHQQLVQLLT
ncbi:poly [ADP-ribose] polymerase tankyrase-1-like [Schistocerca piceifrons]|uniref:poly [ADP-ribose] polymerase tankyrase-1-like n=1 Tax=Schistocerca piceifrons TaxID=274613 RepID=UPI001F5F1F16|nr:poly [ADP-ribose] polymerase tankyrase-1-like [Schistocerca piceifrons]